MAYDPVLSPTHADNDVLILEGVLQGVIEQGARFGLTYPRRQLVALAFQVILASLGGGFEEQLTEVLRRFKAGRPSQPEGGRDGDNHLPGTLPRLPR